MKYTLRNMPMAKIYSIDEFKKEFKTKYSDSANNVIGYHMLDERDLVDWIQPVRDRFLILTPKTKKFYDI